MIDTVILQLAGHTITQADALAPAPDLSASRAIKQFCTMIPGAFASLLMLFTFGTTKHFRDTIAKTFFPCWARWKQSANEPPTETNQSAETVNTYSSDRVLLGGRFADRGSWLAGVRMSGSTCEFTSYIFDVQRVMVSSLEIWY